MVVLGALFLLLLLATPLAAQGLPGLQQFEVENARLVLLDKDGNRRGMLEGKVARKKRDGNVEVEGAVLTLSRGDGKVVVRAASFLYTPATEAFDCPQGLQAELPDGGGFELPAAKGTISISAEPVLKATGTGAASFRSAAPERALLRADITDPEVEVMMRESAGKLELQRLKLTGLRGGEVLVRVEAAPAPDGRGAVPGVMSLGCFGDMTVELDAVARTGAISMLRRARMGLLPDKTVASLPAKPLEITANLIKLRGTIDGTGTTDLARDLKGLEIDASGTVHIGGPTFEGFGNELVYREPAGLREATLLGNPSMDVDQTSDKQKALGARSVLRMKSRRAISLSASVTDQPGLPPWLEVKLDSGAQLWRETDTRAEWRISGSSVSLSSVQLSFLPGVDPDIEPRRRESFAVEIEGYSPLLRVSGAAGLTEAGQETDQRAAVFGARAFGLIENDYIDASVFGPDILALMYADQSIADEMRYALGLRQRPTQPQPRPGRLAVRAQSMLRVQVSAARADATSAPRPLVVDAAGSVELEHAPLPRDDRDLVSFTGDRAGLALLGTRITRAELQGADCLATLGYDLLLSRGFSVGMDAPRVNGFIAGPGRLVVRDQESLSYFRRGVERLPRRGLAVAQSVPDAGWMNFEGEVRLQADDDMRRMEVYGPLMRMVLGEFEKPRAGPSAVKDLPELEAAEVQRLYTVQGNRLLLASSGHGSIPPAVVNLLRLEGDALIRSEMDRLQATAVESIEATGADDQRAVGNPLSVILLGKPVLAMEDAGLFFGDVVRQGTFSYDGAWRVSAGDRLEITFRPLAAGDPVVIKAVREDLGAVRKSAQPAHVLLEQAWRARVELQRLVAGLPVAYNPETEQTRLALRAAMDAELALRRAVAYESGVVRDVAARARASRSAARAENLLSGLIEVAASGGVDGKFSSTEGATPPLNLGMTSAIVTFNGVGEIVDTKATGPVRVSRGDYVITGTRLSQARDGTLLLDGAQVRLPDNTGMEITGLQTVSLRQMADDPFNPAASRTMVTRVSGRDLKVRVKLTKTAPAK